MLAQVVELLHAQLVDGEVLQHVSRGLLNLFVDSGIKVIANGLELARYLRDTEDEGTVSLHHCLDS